MSRKSDVAKIRFSLDVLRHTYAAMRLRIYQATRNTVLLGGELSTQIPNSKESRASREITSSGFPLLPLLSFYKSLSFLTILKLRLKGMDFLLFRNEYLY